MGDPDDGGRDPLTIRSYPTRDVQFASHVADAVGTAREEVVGDDELGHVVEQRLRQVYPNAVVRMQQRLARLLDPAGTVYAFRDGSIEPDDLREDRLGDDERGATAAAEGPDRAGDAHRAP